MTEVKATLKFMRLAKKVMTPEALQELIDELVCDPEKGAIIKNTGGIRKIRCSTGKGSGKSGGIRVIYYYDGKHIIFLITLYKKSDKDDIDEGEKIQLRKLIEELLRG